MRELFVSEARCIDNMVKMKWGDVFVPHRPVLKEQYYTPIGRPASNRFNNDFDLDFIVRASDWPDSQTTMQAILPGTLGAEVFLTVEKDSYSPMFLHTVAANAFGIKNYKRFIHEIEVAIRNALNDMSSLTTARLDDFVEVMPLKNAEYSRVLIVGTDITFLAFPKETKPAMQGQCITIARGDDKHINVFVDDDRLFCFDGWLRTSIAPTDVVRVRTAID